MHWINSSLYHCLFTVNPFSPRICPSIWLQVWLHIFIVTSWTFKTLQTTNISQNPWLNILPLIQRKTVMKWIPPVFVGSLPSIHRRPQNNLILHHLWQFEWDARTPLPEDKDHIYSWSIHGSPPDTLSFSSVIQLYYFRWGSSLLWRKDSATAEQVEHRSFARTANQTQTNQLSREVCIPLSLWRLRPFLLVIATSFMFDSYDDVFTARSPHYIE